MRGVALSDLHLGIRQFAATCGGRNQRELDVEAAWVRAIENAIAEDPDLITIAGDCFHHPRVGLHAILGFRDGIQWLLDHSEAQIVVLEGNHDGARTAESLSPVAIARGYERVHVVSAPKRIHLEVERTRETVAVACFPFVARAEEKVYRLEPDEAAAINVLCIHAPLAGEGLPRFYAGTESIQVERAAERFDVVAAGDWHQHTRLHPDRLAFYSGAIERTSSNIWQETEPKGVVAYQVGPAEYDVEMRFVPHETRPVVDLRLNDSAWMVDPVDPISPDAAGVNAYLAGTPEDEIEGRIVRLVVEDFPREERDRIDWGLVREAKARALHFQLDLRFAERERVAIAAHREGGGGNPLAQAAREFFAGEPEEVRATAFGYLGVEADVAGSSTSDEEPKHATPAEPAEVAV